MLLSQGHTCALRSLHIVRVCNLCSESLGAILRHVGAAFILWRHMLNLQHPACNLKIVAWDVCLAWVWGPVGICCLSSASGCFDISFYPSVGSSKQTLKLGNHRVHCTDGSDKAEVWQSGLT